MSVSRRRPSVYQCIAAIMAMAVMAVLSSAQPTGESEDTSEVLRQEDQLEVVLTANYEIHLSPHGAVPVRWDIVDSRSPNPDSNQNGDSRRIGLVSTQFQDREIPRTLDVILPGTDDLATAFHRSERVEESDHTVVHFYSPTTPSGLRWIRSYRIPRQGFQTEISLTLINEGSGAASLHFPGDKGGLGLRLGPGLQLELDEAGGLGASLYSYVRPVFRFDGEVESPELEAEEPRLDTADALDWGGIHSRYYVAALAPLEKDDGGVGRFSGLSTWLPQPPLTADDAVQEEAALHPFITIYSRDFSIAPGESLELSYILFFGPKARPVLESTPFNLKDILFPGLWNWMRWFCFLLMTLLSSLHAVFGNWGLAIIALAVVIRIVTFPVAHIGLKQQASMAADQARLKPYIAEINEEYKDDASRRSQELMRLYDKHGVNPFASFKGCLWVLIQLPIFIALFNLLGQAFELRGAGFLWLDDLSEPDKLFPLGVDLPLVGSYFNILPIIMVITQVLVTKLSSTSPDASDNTQNEKFMLAMGVLFLLLFYSFPAGLVLYWTAANLGHLGQHSLMIRGSQKRKRRTTSPVEKS